MKTTKVYVNDSLVVLCGEWPVEPERSFRKYSEGEWNSIFRGYEQALKKAIEEAVPFEDQKEIRNIIINSHEDYSRSLKPGFYDIQAEVKIKSTPCKDGDYKCEDGCWGSNTGCQWPNKVAVITPLSSGEKEEKCPKCDGKGQYLEGDYNAFMVDCDCRPSSVDTNIEEKKKLWGYARKIVAAIKAGHFMDKKLTDKEFEELEENWFDWLAEIVEEYATTTPVQEKPDFQQAAIDLMGEFKNGVTKIPGYDWHVGCVDHYGLKSALEKFWKNYVEKQPKV